MTENLALDHDEKCQQLSTKSIYKQKDAGSEPIVAVEYLQKKIVKI
jgi:hypothetical protein